ncbi:MAG: hypothetical protein HY898_21240 [Deltaproteobacteria bacterium]|nr:hypothetical protein [Deltaproteobacteria bacterium]
MEPTPESQPPAESKAPTAARSLLKEAATGLVVVLVVFGILFTIFRSYPSGSAQGEIRATGAPHGDFVVQPTTCVRGDQWNFDGVWVTPELQTRGDRTGFKGGLKLIQTNVGDVLAIVENPLVCNGFKCEQRQVERQHCKVFDINVSKTSIWLRQSGHARLQCEFPAGGTLKVDLTFKRCASVPSTGGDV